MEQEADNSRKRLQSVVPRLGGPDIVQRLESALAGMPEQRRAIFLAVRVVGLSYPEVARRTGLSITCIEREIAAALLQLDGALGRRRAMPPWRRFVAWIGRKIGR